MYARWIWLAERISPAQVFELGEKLMSRAEETKRMERFLCSSPSRDLEHLFVRAYIMEIEIGRRLLRFENARNCISLWRHVQALVERHDAEMQALRNVHLNARLDAISRYVLCPLM